jgi:hypothetical protein
MTKKKPPTPVLTNAERQARWRARQKVERAALEEAVREAGLTVEPRYVTRGTDGPRPPLRNASLRNADGGRNRAPLRNAPPDPGEALDDRLTALRQHGDALLAEYLRLLQRPGLSGAEARTVAGRYREWLTTLSKAIKASSPRIDGVVRRVSDATCRDAVRDQESSPTAPAPPRATPPAADAGAS